MATFRGSRCIPESEPTPTLLRKEFLELEEKIGRIPEQVAHHLVDLERA